MRSRQYRALVVSVLLAVLLASTPVAAAPRDGRRERVPVVEKVIKQIKRVLGISTNADGLTLPTP